MADIKTPGGPPGGRTSAPARARRRAALLLCLCASGCHDRTTEALAVDRCERLLVAQELDGLHPADRSVSRAAIRPKDDPRIRDGERTIFVRRSYDRPRHDRESGTEARDYTCSFDKQLRKVTTLSTNGHEQEFLMGDSEWLAARRRSSSGPTTGRAEPAPAGSRATPR